MICGAEVRIDAIDGELLVYPQDGVLQGHQAAPILFVRSMAEALKPWSTEEALHTDACMLLGRCPITDQVVDLGKTVFVDDIAVTVPLLDLTDAEAVQRRLMETSQRLDAAMEELGPVQNAVKKVVLPCCVGRGRRRYSGSSIGREGTEDTHLSADTWGHSSTYHSTRRPRGARGLQQGGRHGGRWGPSGATVASRGASDGSCSRGRSSTPSSVDWRRTLLWGRTTAPSISSFWRRDGLCWATRLYECKQMERGGPGLWGKFGAHCSSRLVTSSCGSDG